MSTNPEQALEKETFIYFKSVIQHFLGDLPGLSYEPLKSDIRNLIPDGELNEFIEYIKKEGFLVTVHESKIEFKKKN